MTTAGRAAGVAERRGEGAGMALVRWTLGALFIDQFFVNLHDGNYTQSGYVRLVTGYMRNARSPVAWHSAERFAIHHAQVFAVVQAVGELSLGIALALGVLRPVAALVAGLWLLTLWLSELALGWIWEFPPIIVGSFAVAFANVRWSFRAPRIRDRLLGPRVGRPLVTAPAAVIGGLVLAGFILAHHDPSVEAWRAAALFTASLLGSAFLDRLRAP